MAKAEVVWVIARKQDGNYYAPAERSDVLFHSDVRKAVKFATRSSARAVMRHIFAEGTVSAVERVVG